MKSSSFFSYKKLLELSQVVAETHVGVDGDDAKAVLHQRGVEAALPKIGFGLRGDILRVDVGKPIVQPLRVQLWGDGDTCGKAVQCEGRKGMKSTYSARI